MKYKIHPNKSFSLISLEFCEDCSCHTTEISKNVETVAHTALPKKAVNNISTAFIFRECGRGNSDVFSWTFKQLKMTEFN